MKNDVASIMKRQKLILIFLFILVLGQMIISTIFPYITKYIIDDVLLKGRLTSLKSILAFTIILILVQIPINIGVSYSSSKWVQQVIFDLRQEISERFLSSKENLKKNGLFINTITNDCEMIGNQLLTVLLNGIPNILLIILYIIVLVNLNLKLTINIVATIPIFIVISWVTSKKVYTLSIKLQKYRDQLTEFLNVHVHNKFPIDLYGLRNEEKSRFQFVTNKVKDSNIKTNTIIVSLSMISSILAVIVPLMTLFTGSIMVVNKELSLGGLIAFNSYTALLFPPLTKILNTLPLFAQIKVSFNRINELNFSDIREVGGEYRTMPLESLILLRCENLIPYIDGKGVIVEPISFSVARGEIWRIAGPNGVGKSLLLKCLIRYNENFSGVISIKNNQKVVYVPQDNFLFEGTIYTNMTIGLKEFDKVKLHELTELLSLDIDLYKEVTPFNLDISSGQLQKIKIIHALLSNPDILILDETLANIDSETIRQLVKYLKKICLTTIIVNHGYLGDFLQASEYQVLHLEKSMG